MVPSISYLIGCIINGVDRINFYQCHFFNKKKLRQQNFPVKIKLLKITIKEVILLSLSNFILNIQDNNIFFPEEEYYQIIKENDYLIKIFKTFFKSNSIRKVIIKKGNFLRFYSQKILLIMLIVNLNFLSTLFEK